MRGFSTAVRRGAAALLAGLAITGTSEAAVRPVNPLYQPAGAAQEHLATHARALVAKKRYAEAVAEFDKAIALQPQWAALITERAFSREAMGDLEGAMTDYDAVLVLAPDHANSWSHVAWIRALRGVDLDQALAYSDKSIRLGATIDALDTRGFVRFRRGEFPQALTAYDALLKHFPRSASTLYMRGVVKRRAGDTTAGDADIARALKLTPDIGDHWARRGVTP
jgi:tetratricopeptide (TPR) repeat protein